MPGPDRSNRWRLAAVLLLAALCPVTALPADASGTVSHHLSFPEAERQYLQVVSRFPASSQPFELVLPNWTPGAYEIRDYASDLDRIEARDAAGRRLALRKVRKNAWRVDATGGSEVVVEYDVHAGDLSVSTSWVEPGFALVNGATAFLYTDATRSLPQHVTVDAPAAMGQVMTALPGSSAKGWRARNFDELVDNPLVIAPNQPRSFEQDGHRYHFLNVGHTAWWDEAQAVSDVRAVVAAANELWREVPLERDYWFFNLLVERRGGLEHDHSTVMMASRWQMRERLDYMKWLGLVAHEYLHLWNVRRMRPAALATYDYEHEQYSRALWLAEGLTSYYDNLLLVRAGLITPMEYFKRLAEDLHRLELTPGRRMLSLEQASLDAWIRHYRRDANSINSTVSYYTKGAVLGLALDMRVRDETGGDASLDDVMRLMYRDWSDQPYPPGAFRRAVAAVAGAEVRAWLEPLLTEPADPDIDAALKHVGLVLDRHPERAAAEASGIAPASGFGVNWEPGSDQLVAGAVIAGLAGARAGILPGDELLAIGGDRVLRATLDDRLRRLRPGEAVELLVSRRNRLMTLSLVLEEARPASYEIRLDADAGRRSLRRLEDWLGQDILVAERPR